MVAVVQIVILASALEFPVNLFTGTSGVGHTHPAASRPFGMIQAGPDTGEGTWEYCSGYQFADDRVLGYSQNHLNGTGCPDYGDVQVLPFSGLLRKIPMACKIDKGTESAVPGYYTVRQVEDGVKVEIAAAKRAVIYRFSWDVGRDAKVLVNLPFGHNCEREGSGWAICRTSAPSVNLEERRGLSGEYFREGWIGKRRISFVMEFNCPWQQAERLPVGIRGEAPRYVISFGKLQRPLEMKIALSMKSAQAAKKNLQGEIPDWDFESVRDAARSEWESLFARAVVEGTYEQRTNWYTALYHLFLQPNDWSDIGEEPYYTTLSFWDTFRAAHPLYTILAPEVVVPTIRSTLRLGRETGRIPVMSYGGKNVDCMIGNHAIPVIADAYLKGFRGFDVNEAFEAMTNTLSVAHPGKPKEDWDQYARYGYFPCDMNTGEGVSRTLECAYDDACAARFFVAIGRQAEAAEYARRSKNWQRVFDSASGFMRGKDSKGCWRTPFDPLLFGHENSWAGDFTEGNSWQYTWHVMQDPCGLIEMMGGKTRFGQKLEMLFNLEVDVDKMRKSKDVSGMIGQYVHGNEPSHHVIYLFQYAGRSDLLARYIRKVFDTQYRPAPDGLCGNDDCGQMSAWYLFSAMGFYPLDPCGGEYIIGAPQVPRAEVKVRGAGGLVNKFTVIARGLSKEGKYVKSATLNGKPITDWKIRHADIVNGGELVFEMGVLE